MMKEGKTYTLKEGALKNFDIQNVIVKMFCKYFYNSANTLQQENIDKLINAPKIRVNNFQIGRSKLINLSLEFNRINNNEPPAKSKSKKKRKYFCRDIEYYVSIVDGSIAFFVATFTRREGINSVAISYLPEGKVENAIFLARVCCHPTSHNNKFDDTVIKGGQVHLHIATERFYEQVKASKPDANVQKLAKLYADPDAFVLEPIDGVTDVKRLARKMFKLGGISKSVNICAGKDSIKILKRNIERNI